MNKKTKKKMIYFQKMIEICNNKLKEIQININKINKKVKREITQIKNKIK